MTRFMVKKHAFSTACGLIYIIKPEMLFQNTVTG